MKKFEQVTKVINGKEYKAQFNGFANMYKTLDRTYIDGTQTTSMYKMAEYLLENVLIEPKMSIDDFESGEELNEVIAFLGEVNNGQFRADTNEETSKTKGRK